ncbi:MAG: hypothetical protein ACI861_001719 [Paracoccaceae bacterium]|jgi:hypothetical protein
MRLNLSGSCHCKAVTFTVQSSQPYPFNQCYCGICRKTAGSGGYAINLAADFETLQIKGSENISVYRAKTTDVDTGKISESTAERSFCMLCGSALWLWAPEWPALMHPHASTIDSELPQPPQKWHMMLGSKASWAVPIVIDGDRKFDAYPDESLTDWHDRQAKD